MTARMGRRRRPSAGSAGCWLVRMWNHALRDEGPAGIRPRVMERRLSDLNGAGLELIFRRLGSFGKA